MQLAEQLLQLGFMSPLAHAYILSGQSDEQLSSVAQTLAKGLVCQGDIRPCQFCVYCQKANRQTLPDISIIKRTLDSAKPSITVGQIRQMIADVHVLPNETEHKVYIIENADTMNVYAQNALLKTLEEPPFFVTFVLLAQNVMALLPTIRSRCFSIVINPSAQQTHVSHLEAAELCNAFFSVWQKDDLAFAEFCISLDKIERKTLLSFVDVCYAKLIGQLAQETMPQSAVMHAIHVFSTLQQDLQFNVGTGHITGKLMASFNLT